MYMYSPVVAAYKVAWQSRFHGHFLAAMYTTPPWVQDMSLSQFLNEGMGLLFPKKTLQELGMLSSVTLNYQVTKIVMNSGSQLSEL